MGNENTVDARGLSCPQPALMARQELQKASRGMVDVIVDNTTALENVLRTARNLGWAVTIDERAADEIHLVMEK